ncbi:MAG: hypothetical protein LBK82_17200 [Planctomycetaceae bacterium]|jgi:hypothetical protein|nr:hypothetical protein [Planctomycetaceae bacterium]
MKRILFSFILLFCLIFIIGQNISTNCYAQATAGQHNPYQNLAKWYGTQSAPTALEKAQWGLEDVNVYRIENGLKPLPETILKRNTRHSPVWLDFLFFMCFSINIVLFIFWIIVLVKEHKQKRQRQIKEKIFTDNNGNPLFTDYVLFQICWKNMDEWRRRNSTGLFVKQMDREPTDYEIATGEIQTNSTETD